MSTIALSLICCLLLIVVDAVDRSKFRTCSLTGFCRRYRGKKGLGPYRIDSSSVFTDGQIIKADITGSVESPIIKLLISVYSQETFRIKISEESPRWQVHSQSI